MILRESILLAGIHYNTAVDDQSINQSIKSIKSINQPIKSANQPTNQPIKQAYIEQPTSDLRSTKSTDHALTAEKTLSEVTTRGKMSKTALVTEMHGGRS